MWSARYELSTGDSLETEFKVLTSEVSDVPKFLLMHQSIHLSSRDARYRQCCDEHRIVRSL